MVLALEVYSVPLALGMLQQPWQWLPTAHLYRRGWVCTELMCDLGQGNLFTLQLLIWHFCQQTQALTAAAASLCAAPGPRTLLSPTATSPWAHCLPLPPPSYLYCLSAPPPPHLSLQTFIFASHSITAKPPRSHKNLPGSWCEPIAQPRMCILSSAL